MALVKLVLEVSPEGMAFRRRWPARFAAIAVARACDEDDLLVKSSLVVLRRR